MLVEPPSYEVQIFGVDYDSRLGFCNRCSRHGSVVRLWHIDLPIVFPLILALLRPLAWIEHFFWPHPTIFYTPYSYVVNGPPEWLRWVWLMSVSYLIGALVGKLAQIAVAKVRRKHHHSFGSGPPKLTLGS